MFLWAFRCCSARKSDISLLFSVFWSLLVIASRSFWSPDCLFNFSSSWLVYRVVCPLRVHFLAKKDQCRSKQRSRKTSHMFIWPESNNTDANGSSHYGMQMNTTCVNKPSLSQCRNSFFCRIVRWFVVAVVFCFVFVFFFFSSSRFVCCCYCFCYPLTN